MSKTELVLRKMKSKFGEDIRIDDIIRKRSVVDASSVLVSKVEYSRAKATA